MKGQAGDAEPASASRRHLLVDAGAATLAVAVATLAGEVLASLATLPSLPMVFLASVLACAAWRGTRAAVFASLLSFLAYDFFFVAPLYTLSVAEPEEVFALVMFLVVAVATGSLAGRLRAEASAALRRSRQTQALLDLSQRLSASSTAQEVLDAAAGSLSRMIGGGVMILVPAEDRLDLRAAAPPDLTVGAADLRAARWVMDKGQPAGWMTGQAPELALHLRPLRRSQGPVGVCAIRPADPSRRFSADEEGLLTIALDQTAIALERADLAQEALRIAALRNEEAVRDALLASLSHDLRTPLATVTGAASSLRELGDRMSAEQRQELLHSIEQESARLSRFVANLLDMSRIESGSLKVRREWVDVSDVIRAAVERSRKAFPDQPTQMSLERDLPFIRGDATLLEQVLFNLLDNAHKYAGGGGAVVHARREQGDVVISVTDEGPGIRPGDLPHIFDKFYRGGRRDGRSAGTGLGLSICQGLVAAMGGTIEAQSPALRRRGTRMLIRFPAAQPAGGTPSLA